MTMNKLLIQKYLENTQKTTQFGIIVFNDE